MNMVKLDGKKVCQVDQGQAGCHRRGAAAKDDQAPKDGQWQKNDGSKLQRCPKATFDIIMAKYKEY
jgi:hypothetical protein